MKVGRFFFSLMLLFCMSFFPYAGFSQSTTAGDIAGTVTDPSGAVVPDAKVTAANENTGIVHSTTTNSEGFYRFSFLQPGPYKLTLDAKGFQTATRKIQVAVGQTGNGNVAMAISASTTIVEVTTSPLQVDNGDNSTSFNNQQIALVPNPGNDLSAIAQTSPGAVMNTQSGYGNFSVYGLPGTSNLFTIDGQNGNDPFLNLNNSGATNLLLGANDVQEATVTSNGYSGQYGQLAGAQVNYVTKSGGNQFHGNAAYYWNGRVLNANNYLNNLAIAGSPSTPRPFDNVNQWALSFGGPIRHDKTFFFFNYEGLRVVLPTSGQSKIPDPAFEAAAIANLTTNGHAASVPFYQNLFSLYNSTPGAAGGTPVPCSNFSGAGPCALRVQSTATNFTREYQMSLKIDQKFSEKDSIFVRGETDRGLQATFTDRINPIFNTQSAQPQYQVQLSETHVFNPNMVNEFKTSLSWYSVIFDNTDPAAARAAFPTTLQFFGGDFSRLGGINFLLPQGRNVTQYQFVDDFSYNHRNHTWRFGANFRRYDVTDLDGILSGGLAVTSVDTFFNGGVDFFQKNFPSRLSQPIALYGLSFYGQDEWRLRRNLKVTLALRVDHNSNPVCQTNCFARLKSPFTSLVHDANVPYNQIIQTGLHQAYPSTDGIIWQPRAGFAYSPFSSDRTVLRGGIGIFGDSFPASLVENFSSNPPVLNSFVTAGDLSPDQPGNIFSSTATANAAFTSGFASGANLATLAAIPGFVVPSITSSDSKIRQPRYQEWNLEVERNLGWNTVLSVNYVGNHGIFEAVLNNGLNAFADSGAFPGGFAGLPSAPPDPRFGVVTQAQSIAVSNYNGLVTSVSHNGGHGITFRANYTWSHALDEISNGGLLPFNNATNISIISPLNPFNIRRNYGNADYDIRHYFSVNYVWDDSLRHLFHWGPNAIFSGWTFSGTIFARSGLPFSVVDSSVQGALGADNFGGSAVLANIVGPATNGTCGKTAATPDPGTGIVTPCLNFSGFASPTGLDGNQARNQFRGPRYFNTDLSIMKYTRLTERTRLAAGFQFFNLFNHPNFDQPINDIAAGDAAAGGAFGTSISTLNTPTSILGSFLGGDASPRLIQFKAEIKF